MTFIFFVPKINQNYDLYLEAYIIKVCRAQKYEIKLNFSLSVNVTVNFNVKHIPI